MSQVQTSSTSQPWGMISLGSGSLALFMMTAGCLFGLSYVALPFAVIGIVAGEMEVQKLRAGEFAEMQQATMGIVFSTVALAIQLLTMMAVLFMVLCYILFIVGVVVFA